MSGEYYIEVDEVLRENANSILIKLADTEHAVRAAEDTDEVWIPKSQIQEESEVHGKGDVGTLVVSDWLEKERGW